MYNVVTVNVVTANYSGSVTGLKCESDSGYHYSDSRLALQEYYC